MRIIGNLLWWLFGGLEAAIGKQHFKMAGLSLAPFGKDVELGF